MQCSFTKLYTDDKAWIVFQCPLTSNLISDGSNQTQNNAHRKKFNKSAIETGQSSFQNGSPQST